LTAANGRHQPAAETLSSGGTNKLQAARNGVILAQANLVDKLGDAPGCVPELTWLGVISLTLPLPFG
jgi:hypothetical protein